MSAGGSLLDALAQRRLLLGGATGTELLAARPDIERVLEGPGTWLERLNRTAPELVRGVHARFLAAGCDALATNSFRAVCDAASPDGLGPEAAELARRAAELARAACEAAAAPARFALGSLGPGSLDGEGSARALRKAVNALAAGGADALLFETCSTARQVEAALDAARAAAPGLPVFVSFTVTPAGVTRAGVGPAQMASLCASGDVALVALNCSYGPESLDAPLRHLREQWDGPLGAWPNAGVPDGTGGAHPIGPDELARWVASRAPELDLRLVGGCCGSTPAHARAIAGALGRDS